MSDKGYLRVPLWTQVLDERARQDKKWGEQNHPNGTGPRVSLGTFGANKYAESIAAWAKVRTELAREEGELSWRHILMEEVMEAFAAPDTDALRAELIQVMATALAWIECIDRRAPVKPGED